MKQTAFCGPSDSEDGCLEAAIGEDCYMGAMSVEVPVEHPARSLRRASAWGPVVER
jgi:hypothetical protein